MLEQWEKRPPEEANLFNPAFIGSLLFEFAKEHAKQRDRGTPLTYVPIFLAVVLHRTSRLRLPYSTVTSLYEWLQRNEDVLIGLVDRIHGLRPYIQEAVRFGIIKQTLHVSKGHELNTGQVQAHFSAGFLRETTAETKEIIERTKFMARWFAKSGSESSIIAIWGMRP